MGNTNTKSIRPYEDGDAADYHVCYLRGVVDGEGNFMCCGRMMRLPPRARKCLFVKCDDEEARLAQASSSLAAGED